MSENEQLQSRIDELEKELAHILVYLKIVGQELRTPLVPMKGFVQSLIDDENEEWYQREDRREFYAILDKNIDRLSRISSEFTFLPTLPSSLELNWQEKQENVDVREIIERVVAIKQRVTEKHQIVLDFEPIQIKIDAVPILFIATVHALISHAIIDSPNGGEIKVVSRVEPPNEIDSYGTLLIEIYTPGSGFDKEKLKSVGATFIKFDPSTPLWNELSLGALVAKLSGVMEFDSEGIDKGKTTRVRIPLKQFKSADANQATK